LHEEIEVERDIVFNGGMSSPYTQLYALGLIEVCDVNVNVENSSDDMTGTTR
jgi:hypothetical protein